MYSTVVARRCLFRGVVRMISRDGEVKASGARDKDEKPGSLVAAAFAPRTSRKERSVDEAIEAATDAHSLLDLVDKSRLNRKQALRIVSVLAEWAVTGHAEMKVFERDPRFTSLCQTLGKPQSPTPPNKSQQQFKTDDLTMVLNVKNDDEASKIVTTFTLQQTVKVLSSLAFKKRRSVPLLRSLSYSISQSVSKTDIKEGADILYALATLNYPDEVVLEKVCSDLCEKIPNCKKTSVLGSISTSIGILRFNDSNLLDCLCEWAVNNSSLIRNQDLSSILLTLAHIGYSPPDAENFFKQVREKLLESDISVSRLEVVWALTVLEQATNEDFASVLEAKFYDRLKSMFSEGLPQSVKKKLLNINGAAKYSPEYKGPLLESLEELETLLTRSKEKQTLVTSVFEAMSNLLPSSVYLRTNIDLKMGFNMEGECLIDSKMTPLPLVDRKTGAPTENKRGIKIAVMVWDYHEHTKGKVDLCGVPKLCQRLAILAGYRVLSVSFLDFNPRDKLTLRVKHLEKQLKALVKPS